MEISRGKCTQEDSTGSSSRRARNCLGHDLLRSWISKTVIRWYAVYPQEVALTKERLENNIKRLLGGAEATGRSHVPSMVRGKNRLIQ
jgi:hypothetical protein